HTYLAAGTYTATITITDDDGLSGTSRISVIVEGESAEGACLPAIDFDHNVTGSTLSSGEIVTDQWSLWGVNVTTHDPINHPAMIFDSSMPSGGDTDLGSPHGDFGGPGIGGGGAAGTGSENASSLGNVLIISEDADSGDPDDDASGGTFIVTFDHPVRMDELGLLDLDSGEDSTITLFDVGGKVIGTTTMTGLGNNAAQTIVLDANNVARMEVELAGSGAITDLVFCRNLLAMSVFGDQTADEGDFYGALLLSPGVNVDDWNVFVTNGDGVQVSSIEFSNTDSPTLSTSFPDGQQNYTIKGWATDGSSVYPIETFTVAVNNVDPILLNSGDAEADAHLDYTIELSSDDPGNDEIIQWIVDWGDGTIETIPGDPGSATHVYEATGNYSITASAFDEDNASMGGRSGLVVIEAESFDASSPGTDNAATSTWVAASDPAASGEEYLLAAPNTGVNTGDSQRGPRLDYSVTFAEAGVYYVWVRMLGSSSQDDSLHVGLNGQPATYGKNGMTDYSGDWHWEQNVNNRNGTDRVAIDVASAGTHTINLWMREDGIAVDKLLITTDSDFQPTDLGPNALVTGEAYVSNTIQVTVDAGDSLWLPNVNFNVDDGGRQLASGDRITDQFASLGFTVSTTDPNHPAMIFDSSNPSGGDNDLGSPNSQYGGPGQGSGGVSNSVARGNVLIISEDNDANDPDDNVSGGALIFDFDQIVMVDEIGFLDVEGGDNRIELYDGDGVFISSTAIPDSGNNGYSRVALDALGVGRMEVHFAASGAITDIEFCRDGGHIPDAPTRFYVTDSDSDHVYRYDTIGESLGEFGAAAALNPRGITTTGEGNPVWIISEEDANERVYVYDTDGETLLGDWNARLLDSPEGIATDGTDIWVVDDGIDKVKRYSNAASRTSGQQFAASEFQLAFGNSDPRGITTDGQTLWTVDVVSKKVFAYEMDGTFVNWWNLDPANDDPAGITINPAGGDGIWIVDATDNAVYHYANATLAYQGDQAAVGVFALDGENSSPTGIADPAVLINVGDTVSGTLADAAQVDEYEFTKELAPLFIQVESVTGGEIRLNYDASFGGSATGIFGPGQVTELTYFDPGTFDFSVSVASGTPTYSVSLLEPPSPSFGVINQGDNVIDSIDAAYATDVWTFNGSAGQTVSIDVASDNGDLFLTIVDTSAVGGLGGAPPLYAGPFTDTGPLSLSSTGAYEISVFSPDAATTGYQFTLDGAALPTIELDTPVLGEIFTAGQADSYKLVGSVGQTLNFDVLTADLFTFSLVSPSGQTLFSDLMADIGPSGTVGRDQNEITLPEAGDYTVTVDSDGGEALSTGPYEFIVTEPAVTDSFINLGDFVSADISEAGEVDRFTFTLSADQSFELDFTSIVGGDLQALVSDGTNVLFTSPLSGTADDLDFGPQLTLPGTYTIEVSSGDSQTPSYEFSLLDGGNLATELTSGASISDEIANASEIDLYTFNAVSGDRVSVDFTTVSGGELAHELIAPNGATIQTASSASASVLGLSSLLLDQSGMYSLRLTGASGETPTYAFGFTRATTNPGIGIMLGQSVSGEINPAFEIDQYTFDVTTDQVFWLDFTSLSGSPVNVTLTSPSGAENTRVVSDTTDYDDSAPVTSSENGAWTISIAGTQPSTTGYAFTVWDVDPTETTTLNLDTLYSDSISSPGASDIYQLTASSGDEYFFNFAEIGTGNLRIDLIAPDGSSAFSERTSFPSIADTRLILEQDGTYELILRGEDSGTPTYGFRVTEVPEPTVRPLELDRAYEDSIEVGFAEDHWNFDAEPGDRIFIDVQSAGTLFTWLTVQLVAPDGSTVFEEEDTLSGFLDSGVIELDQAGTYSVRFLDPRGGTTDYSFQVWEVAPDLNQPLVFNRVYAGNLETPGKVDTYSFEGTSGQSIFLDMQQVFGSLRGVNETLVSSITSPSGVTLVDTSSFLTGPHDAGVFELTETGTYTLNLFGAGDTIPGYQFQLNDVTPGVPVPIAIDQVISDRIDSAGEIRQYTFAATVGTEFVLDVLLNRNVDPFIGEVIGWTVESPSESILVNNSEVDASFTAPETGTYTLTVDNRNEDRGKDTTEPFAFRVIDDPAAFAPQTANLVVSNVVVDSVVVGNPAVIDVTWTVTNAGDTTAIAFGGGAWTDRVYFSADQDQQGIFSITQGDTERLVDLAPGASYQQTASFTLPVGFVGSFWVDVQADATNVVYEGDLLDDNIDQSPLLTAVYTEERAERSGPALSLSPEDGSVFPTGSQIALSGNASSTNESINAIFVIDVSRSTLEVTGLDANGDGLVDENDNLNGDASIADILDAEIGAALQLTDRLVELSDNVAVSTVLFAGGSTIADQGPEDFNQIFNAPSTTTTFRDDVTNLQQTLTSLRPDSIVDFRPDGVVAGTSFDPPIRQVEQLLAGSQDTDRTIVYFLTDGEAFDASLSVAGVADQGIEFFAFQLGGAAVTTELNELADLIDADPSSSGVAKAVTDINDLAGELISTIEIESITVNGVPVTAIDAAGNFFAPVAINAGANPVTVVATSASGATSETQINLFGDEASSIDFTSLLPASAGITSKFSGTTFNRATNQLHTSLAASNETSEGITAPLIATLDNFSTPAVDVISVDSMAPLALGGEEGPGVRGRYAYTSDVPDGTTSDFVELTLSNPLRQRFDFDVNFEVTGNRVPAFSTTPILTATPDQPYSVSVTGVDPDGDTLTIKLLQAPEGAALNGAAIEWSPTSADVGNHSFVVELSDGRGGTATQSYTAFVSTGLADAPPLITSTPTQVGTVEQLYTYDITALDPEGQSVTLTLENGPAGASVIDSQLRWTPAATDLGDYPITILATDSAGNPGRQSFNLTIRPANTPPTFVTDPVSETL
ncbi:MAG: putative Ig domain-containing protein, partial [Planctomycetota bacterium]